MSTTIDERVVEMRFDNQQFESGAKETMNTLSKLKTALDKSDSSKAFEQLDSATKNIHLDGIASGVEALQKRFSVFGLIGMKAINSVADAVVGMTKKLYNATIGTVISGGIKRAMNLENAHFQLQALLKDEEKVQAVMADANKAVDGTAYSLDAAAKAASQFSATGIQAGEEMTNALRGIVGVSAMTNSDFESISNVFTTVAGQGRVMGDQLNQLAARGLNAAATMADFANGVIDGSKSASDEVTALVKSFSKGTKLTEGDIRDLVSKGKISFKLFSESMTDAFADSAERANETFTGALSNVKSALGRIGAGFISPLIEQNSKIVGLFNALRLKINEFKSALVFDESTGNVMAVSKQFTDMVLRLAEVITNFINNIDTASVMRDFYYGLETIKNVFKALWVLVKPALMAMSGLISPIGEAIHTVLVALEAVTSRMIASESASTALGEVFKELVGIVGTLISGILKLIQKVFKPLDKQTKTTNNGLVDLLRTIAQALHSFNDWLKTSPLLNKAFDGMAKAIQVVVKVVGALGKLAGGALVSGFSMLFYGIKQLVDVISASGVIEKIVGGIANAFSKLSEILGSFKIPSPIKNFTVVAKEYSEANCEIGDSVSKVSDGVKNLSSIGEKIAAFGKIISNVFGFIGQGSVKIALFVKQFATIDNLKSIFSKAIDTGSKFISFLIEAHQAIVGTAIGGGIAYGLIKIGKGVEAFGNAFGGIGKVIGNFAGVLGQTQKAIKAYQHDLNASALIKVAGAIAILSGALVILSHIDSNNLLSAATALTMVSVVILGGVSVLSKAVGKTKNVYDVMNTLANQVGKAARTKAIGAAIKDLGMSLLMIAGSIIAIAMMYKNDSAAMNEAVKLVAAIGLVIVGLLTTMSLLGKVIGGGMKSFSLAALGVAALAGSLLVVMIAINKLFEISLPYDYQQKLNILYEVLFSLMAITAVLTLVSSAGHGGKLTTMPIFLLFTSLHSIISAMNRLFKMNLPTDYKQKLGILAGIFAELVVVITALGVASKISGGTIKAGGSIMAVSAFLVAAVGSLAVLTIFPMDKLKGAVISLGLILLSLGTALMMASSVTNANTAKAVLNMAIAVGVITAALSTLTIFDGKDLLKSAASIGAVLLAMGTALDGAGSISESVSNVAILAMITAMAAVAVALYALSNQPWQGMLASGVAMALTLKAYADAFSSLGEIEDLDFKMVIKFVAAATAVISLGAALWVLSNQPWKGMLASGVALGATLMAFAEAFKILGEADAIDKKQIVKFVAAATVVIPLGVALAVLAHQPWDGMLASGVAMSGTLIAFSKAFEILSKADDVDVKKVGNFLLASLSVIPLALALGVLAHQPWDGLLGAAVSLSATLLAFSGCFAIISKTGAPDPKLAASFVLASIALLPIAYSLKMIADYDWQGLLGAAASVSTVLVALSAAMVICSAVGSAAGPALVGIGLLDLFIIDLVAILWAIGAAVTNFGLYDNILAGLELLQEVGTGLGNAIGNFISGALTSVTSSLPEVADNLSAFMNHLKPFIEGCQLLTPEVLQGVLSLADVIMALTKAEILQGLSSLIGGKVDFSTFGEQINLLAPYIKTFANSVAGIDASSVEGAAAAADIITALANSLPREGGWIDNILGSKKTLSEFANELVSFGPSLKLFATTVNGIDASSVEGAAAAGKIMSELADNLPKSDGLVQKIFGDKTLAEFGMELIPFGYAIKLFAMVVKDVQASAVEGAANAGGIMARLADTIPNSGGALGVFFGNNDIDDFGLKLVSFGKSMVEFSDTVKGLDAETLTAVATMTQMMTDLANSLPNTESVFAVFTGGQMDFEDFGKQLAKFGKSLANYSDSISGVDLTAVSSATAAISDIVNLLTMVQGIDPSAMSNFSLALGNVSSVAIQEFVVGFQNGEVLVITAVTQLLTNVQTTIMSFTVPITSTIKMSIATIALATGLYLPLAFNPLQDTMVNIGEFVGKGLAIGLRNSTVEVSQAASDMAKVVEEATRNQLQVNSPSRAAEIIGGFWDQGLAQGLAQNAGVVQKAAQALAKNGVENPIRQSLGIHSPSAVGEFLGEMLPEGMAKGIKNGSEKVESAVDSMTTKVKDIAGTRAEKAAEFLKEKANNETLNTIYEVYGGVKKAVSEENKEVTKEVTDGIEQTTEATKKHHTTSVQAEQNYWAELLKIKQAGIDADKYKDMDLKKFQETTLQEATDIWKTYTDELSSRRDSMMSSFDLFSEVSKQEAVSKEKLKQNLEDQISAYGEYINTMASLNAKIGDTELGSYIQTLGVDSTEQLKVINSMTDEELTNYVNLYDTKMAYATQAASQQLVTLQAETEEKLAGLFGGMADAVNVFDFGKVFDGSFASIDKYVQGVMVPLQESNRDARDEAAKLGESITDGVTDGLDESNIDQVITEPLFEAFEIAKDEQTENALGLGKELGEHIYEGIGEGMSAGAFEDSASQLMNTAVENLRNAGEIHSPSALTEREVGPYLTEGISEGMLDAQPSITDAILEIVQNIITQFDENIESISESAGTVATAIQNGIGNKKGELITDVRGVGNSIMSTMKTTMSIAKAKKLGSDLIQALINGIKAKSNAIIKLVQDLCSDMMKAFEEGLDQNKIENIGLACIVALNQGLSTNTEASVEAAREVCAAVTKAFEDEMSPSKFEDIGKNAVQGMLDGSRGGQKKVEKETEDIANGAVNTAKKVLDEHSPSRVFYKIGKFVPMGLANGISDYIGVVQKASDNMATQSSNAIKDAIYRINDVINGDEFSDEITIKPIVDLSNVQQSTKDIAKMFNSNVKMGTNVASAGASFNGSKSSGGNMSSSGSGGNGTVINNYNMEQNNYSPEALSAIDIYRQTQNQLRFLKTQLG